MAAGRTVRADYKLGLPEVGGAPPLGGFGAAGFGELAVAGADVLGGRLAGWGGSTGGAVAVDETGAGAEALASRLRTVSTVRTSSSSATGFPRKRSAPASIA